MSDAHWGPENYDPQITVDTWRELLNDPQVFDARSLNMIDKMIALGGQASCLQIAQQFGGSAPSYSGIAIRLCRRIISKTQCPLMHMDNGKQRLIPVLFTERPTTGDEPGHHIWRIRPELREAWQLESITVPEEEVPDETESKGYSRDDFLSDVYMSDNQLDDMIAVLRRKQNIILQGAPGVGKTFAATRLAYVLMGEANDTRIEFVQFHQSYGYEDFIMGYRPTADGFELKEGIFLQFCERAAEDPDQDFFFIIDEINRGNLSQIFGELLMAIEQNYRGCDVTLSADGRRFAVPENVYIIGMMNTADRSLSLIDYALRRRFSFIDLAPGLRSEGFVRYQRELSSSHFDALIDQIVQLNSEIADDPALGKGFRIGHSYFCGLTKPSSSELTNQLRTIVDYDLVPMLEEYWFDDLAKAEQWREQLRGAL